MDLAYLPSGTASTTVDLDFFRRLRSSYYIVSGDDPVKEAAMRSILDALLEGKSSWPDIQVCDTFFTFPSAHELLCDWCFSGLFSGDADPNV